MKLAKFTLLLAAVAQLIIALSQLIGAVKSGP